MSRAAASPWQVLGRTAAVAVGVQYLPSVMALGQWTERARALPAGICRWRGPSGTPAVALTFDDGPDPEATPRVLDRLDELGLRATFFPLGSLVERHPEIVAEVARRGHQVGTHGHRHERHLLRTPRWVLRDLRAALAAMEGCGMHPRWYRPSYGQFTGSTLAAARALGLRTILWSSWGREWTTEDAGEVADRVIRELRPGAVVLLHDNDDFGPPGMWRVALSSLGRVADELDRRGLEAVTLDQLVSPEPAPSAA